MTMCQMANQICAEVVCRLTFSEMSDEESDQTDLICVGGISLLTSSRGRHIRHPRRLDL